MTSDAPATTFDAVVIGAGQAGPGIAYHLVSTGRTVALIEADKVGGHLSTEDVVRPRRCRRRHVSPIWRERQGDTAYVLARSPSTSLRRWHARTR